VDPNHPQLHPLLPGSDLCEHDALSVRAINVLNGVGVVRLAEVASWNDERLLAIRGLGVGVLEEIRSALAAVGADLGRYPAARARLAEVGGDPGQIRVVDLALSHRATRALVEAGLETLAQAETWTDLELLTLPKVGTRSVHEYRSTVADALHELLGPARAERVLEGWAEARDSRPSRLP
jgi:DNA-directed RNA polymerase alpha subunit